MDQNIRTIDPNINLLANRRTSVGILPLFKTLGARDLFAVLNAKREASRPVVGQDRGPFKIDKSGRKRYFGKPTPVYGEPTFRNRIEQGVHV